MTRCINIFYFVLNWSIFCILALLNLNRFYFYCSYWWRQYIVIISLRLAYIIEINTLYGRLRCYWSIQILIIICISIILWYWRFYIHSLVLHIFNTILIVIILLVLTVIYICFDSTLILFRKMFRTYLVINVFIYFANIV
jgi:hypothetical protein